MLTVQNSARTLQYASSGYPAFRDRSRSGRVNAFWSSARPQVGHVATKEIVGAGIIAFELVRLNDGDHLVRFSLMQKTRMLLDREFAALDAATHAALTRKYSDALMTVAFSGAASLAERRKALDDQPHDPRLQAEQDTREEGRRRAAETAKTPRFQGVEPPLDMVSCRYGSPGWNRNKS